MSVIKVEYIWIDGYGTLRSKTRISNTSPNNLNDLASAVPTWNYDGSSTGQAPGKDSEVVIRPVARYPDPFRGPPHVLVLCDTWLPDGTPHPSNTREKAKNLFDQRPDLEPRFGLEQEFFLSKGGWPIGFPADRSLRPAPQKDYYCGVGGDYAMGRQCVDEAFDKCIAAGINVTGLNAEVAPSQWEFQVDAYGINVGDQLYIMRYIIDRTAEKYGWTLDLRPKPVPGDWNGSGCHCNFSTKPMREEGGLAHIIEAIKCLEQKHAEHIEVYGKDNHKRLTGRHETADINTFSWGVADRGASIRVPRLTERDGKGYLEDRRPASNMDPYLVTSKIFETTSLLNPATPPRPSTTSSSFLDSARLLDNFRTMTNRSQSTNLSQSRLSEFDDDEDTTE